MRRLISSNIRVDQNGRFVGLFQRLDGLRARVVEFSCLANRQASRPNDQDFGNIDSGTLGAVFLKQLYQLAALVGRGGVSDQRRRAETSGQAETFCTQTGKKHGERKKRKRAIYKCAQNGNDSALAAI